jgi:hypothetical protein
MDAAHQPSLNLMDVLGSTLERVEKSAEFSADDPALQEFNRSILRVIADLQIRRERKLYLVQRSEKTSRTALMLIVKPGGKDDPTQL